MSGDEITEEAAPHAIHSTLREQIVEHVFVGDVLRRLWQRGVTDVEVLRSEFDAGGYDLVVSSVVRAGSEVPAHAPAVLAFLDCPAVYYCHEPPRRFYEPKLPVSPHPVNMRR